MVRLNGSKLCSISVIFYYFMSFQSYFPTSHFILSPPYFSFISLSYMHYIVFVYFFIFLLIMEVTTLYDEIKDMHGKYFR